MNVVYCSEPFTLEVLCGRPCAVLEDVQTLFQRLILLVIPMWGGHRRLHLRCMV